MSDRMVRYQTCNNCLSNGFTDLTEQFGKYMDVGGIMKKFWECQGCHTYMPDESTREPIEYRIKVIDGRTVLQN